MQTAPAKDHFQIKSDSTTPFILVACGLFVATATLLGMSAFAINATTALPIALCIAGTLQMAATAVRLVRASQTFMPLSLAISGIQAFVLAYVGWLIVQSAPASSGLLASGLGGLGFAALCLCALAPAPWHPQIRAAICGIPTAGMAAGLLFGVGGNLSQSISGLGVLAATFAISIVWWAKAEFAARANKNLTKMSRNEKMLIEIVLDNDADSPGNWSFELDETARLRSVSHGFESATGITSDVAQGLDFIAFLENLDAKPAAQIGGLKTRFATNQPFRNVELQLPTSKQTTHWRLSGSPLIESDGSSSGFVGVCFDVTAAQRTEAEIAKMAHFDALTGLINRGQFNFQLDHLVGRLERYGSAFTMMLLDLDNFKAINDARGHLAGDAILSIAAQRIRECVRETDMPARVGGDEFAVLFPGSASRQEIEVVAQRIVAAMQQPFDVEDEPLHIGISAGIVLAPINGTRPAQLMRNADLALYRAKHAGRNTYKFFEAEMDAEAREKRLLESELREALQNGEIELYFQPLVDSNTGETTSFEALVRWNHPIRGIVSPVEFIPIAEETGSIVEIGNWTINEACRVAKTWPEDIKVAVNLSPRHFSDTDIVQVTKDALETNELPSNRLELEITEGVLMESEVDVTSRLTALQNLGVTIAMDDFGTGYSSLSYLMKFSFDKIKIDKSFVDKIPTDSAAQRILRAITSLGESLKISITAEGVESKEQAEFLNDIACQTLQGYYFAKPLREIDLAAFLLNSSLRSQQPQVATERDAKQA